MKKLIIAIAIFLIIPAMASAGNYRFDGIYEISVPDDWRVISNSHSAELMKQAKEIATKTNASLDVDLKDIATPFMIYKEESNGAFLIRVMVGPPELTKDEFNSLTVQEINLLGEEVSKRQNEILRSAGVRLVSSQFGSGTFKGIPAVRTESISYNTRGFKVSRAQYVVYRTSVTLVISLEHTVRSGEPSYKLIESRVSGFKVLAK